jgi:multidrug transporter EmrE-like cation transporter
VLDEIPNVWGGAVVNAALILAVGSGMANAVVAVASKGAERSRCRLAPYSAIALGTAAATAFAVALEMRASWNSWPLWLFGIVMVVLFLAAIACMLRANRVWNPSMVWSAANMAFVMPILLSALTLGEPMRWVDAVIAAGLLVMLAGLADPKGVGVSDPLPLPKGRRLLLAAVFVTNGLLMYGFKLFGVLLPAAKPSCLVAIMYGSGALVALGLLVVRGPFRFARAEAGWGLVAGAATSAAVLALLPAMRLPAAVAFPAIQGTALVGGVLLCALFFKERLTLRKLGALLCGLAAFVLAGMR